MEAKMEKIDVNVVKFEVKVEADKFKEALTRAYKKNIKKFNVPGFRKGKVPMNVVKKYYGVEVLLEDAVNFSIEGSYAEALKENNVRPVDFPKVEVVQAEEGKDLIYTAEVIVYPEVELGEYKGLNVEKKTYEVTEEEVSAKLKEMQEKNARVETKEEGTVENGNIAVIDFKGFVDGEAFQGGEGHDYSLEIGSKTFIDNFEEQLVGVKKGEEKDVEVTFPENYQAAELAGQPATFHCTVHEVKYKDLPELNDELIKKLKIENVETVDAYKEKVKADLTASKEREAEENFTNELLGKVCDNANVEIPSVMIDAEVDRMYREFEGRMQQSGFTAKQFLEATHQTEEAIRAQMSPEAAARVKTQLVLEAIVKAESIEASDEDVEKEFTTMSEMYNMEVEKIKQLISPESIKADLANQKALDFIKTSVK